MYKNLLLFISVIVAYVAAVLVLFVPATSKFMWGLFNDLDFCYICTPNVTCLGNDNTIGPDPSLQ